MSSGECTLKFKECTPGQPISSAFINMCASCKYGDPNLFTPFVLAQLPKYSQLPH